VRSETTLANISNTGNDWSSAELDAIVADYFEMLGHELARLPYSKAEHNRMVQTLTGRSHGSIEYKYQNISAVLEKLGMPWIFGYKPMHNYQTAIIDAIERHLPGSVAMLEQASTSPFVPPLNDLFVPPPALTEKVTSERLRRLVRKFDPAERDRRNRDLGKAGEEFALEVERRRLTDAGRPDLSNKIRWVSNEDGDGAGYDILSFHLTGSKRLLEIKTTNGAAETPFYVSRNELEVSQQRPEDWLIYRVHTFAQAPRIFTLTPPLERVLHLRPNSYQASF
jgi:Domain of unknown function (DUF3883)